MRSIGIVAASLTLVAAAATTANCQSRPVAHRADPAGSVRSPDYDPSPAAPPATQRSASTSPVRLSAVGDMILGNTPDVPSDPYRYLAPVRRDLRWHAGVVFANLEGTLTTQANSKCGGGGGQCYAFRNPPAFARAFARTGFTVLNDANNHSHDYGQAGLDQTVRVIHRAGMAQTGLPGQITVVEAHGVKVALVGFAPYRNTSDLLDPATARRMIHSADRSADIVVVYLHAGAEGTGAQHVTGHEEYYLGEDRGNAEKFAHLAVRAGADLVIASGPHVLRGMQFFRHRLIAYSLGNFANFHNFAGGGVLSDSAVLHVTLASSGRYLSGRLLSVRLASGGQARPGGDSVSVVRRLSHQDFAATAARLGGKGVITQPPA